MQRVIGTCSLCGGRVTLPEFWWGTTPPVPTCECCGGVKADHGPVIDMKPAPRQRTTLTDNTLDSLMQWGLQRSR